MQRRRMLNTFVATTTGVFAGCSTQIFGNDNQTKVCDISLVNRSDETVQAKLKISQQDAVLVEKDLQLSPLNAEGEVYTVPSHDLPITSEQLIIKVQLVGNGWRREEEYHTVEESLEYTTILWILEDSINKDYPDLQLLTNQEKNQC